MKMLLIRLVLAVLTGLAVGCRPAAESAPAVPDRVSEDGSKSLTLTIYGYNYTRQYIDQFYVDGQGGGNLHVGTATSSGGGGACCYGWREGTSLPQTFRVRWASSACLQRVTNSSGESRDVAKHFFKEREVLFNGPVPKKPHYLEVHFYADERIEIALTEDFSDPRVVPDPKETIEDYPRCKEDE